MNGNAALLSPYIPLIPGTGAPSTGCTIRGIRITVSTRIKPSFFVSRMGLDSISRGGEKASHEKVDRARTLQPIGSASKKRNEIRVDNCPIFDPRTLRQNK